jgi:carboxyl-terminal processing protease
VVLVNDNSASASEVVAGAVKDHGFGHLIGQRTFGKGSVQSVLTFADGDGIRLTTAHFLTPLGHKIDGVGIEPDIYVEPAGTFPGGRVEGRLGQRDLFPGMVGLDVLELQQDLALARFYAGPLDGVFTVELKQALLDLRCKYGVIDPNRLTGAMQSFVAERTRQVASTILAPEIEAALSFLRQAIANAN